MAAMGHVQIQILAGLRDGDKHEVGTVNLPLTLKSVASGTLEVKIEESIRAAALILQRIWDEENADDEQPEREVGEV